MTEALTDGLLFACDEAACAKDARFYEALAMDDRWEIIRAILDAAHRRTPAGDADVDQNAARALVLENAKLREHVDKLQQQVVNREEFIAEQNLWREFSIWLAGIVPITLTEKRPPSNQEGGK